MRVPPDTADGRGATQPSGEEGFRIERALLILF